MKTKEKEKEEENGIEKELQDFTLDAKRSIVDILNDCPSLVFLGGKEYQVRNMRFYSLNRIFHIALNMRKYDEELDDDKKVITAMCTDIDAICEIVAIVLCNHWFTPDNIRTFDDAMDSMSRNDKMISIMKAKIMNSPYKANEWSSIVIAAIKSVDFNAFFLIKKLVNTLTDSFLTRKKKSEETASQFMEALSLQTHQTS